MRSGALTLALVAALVSGAMAVEVPLTVTEPVGVARKAEPVSTGVCFKVGEVKDLGNLALVTKDGKAVPCQFLPLVRLEDGSYQWALLDFQADVPANGSAEYVVKSGTPAAPTAPVVTREEAGVYLIKNGVLTVAVNTKVPAFDVLSSVHVNEKPVMTGAGADALTCRDALNGDLLYHAGKPTKVAWDYRGPMRATLMAEGPFVDADGKEWLAWRVRITVYAGSKRIRIEHSLRNSCATEARHVKIKDAFLRFGLGGPQTAKQTGENVIQTRDVTAAHRLLSGYFSPGLHDLAVEKGSLRLGIVPLYEGPWDRRNHRGYNRNEKGKAGKPAPYNVGDTGSYWLYDNTYKIDAYWLDFGGGGADLARAVNSPLYAIAPAAYYSDCDALGFGRFGSLEDEAQTYANWGWKNIEPKKKALLGSGWMKPKPGYHVPYVLVHEDSETDDAEGCLLMALRTGGRGYFDAGLAWARYYTNNFVARVDYPRGTKRGKGKRMNFVGHDVHIMAYHESYGNGRTCGCHFYGSGAMDYYVLTGEKSLLLGCLDLGAYARARYGDVRGKVPGKSTVSGWGSRAFGRQFMALVRLYEITRDPAWKKTMDHAAQMALKDPNYVRASIRLPLPPGEREGVRGGSRRPRGLDPHPGPLPERERVVEYGFLRSPGSNSMEKKHVTSTIKRYPRLREYLADHGLKWDGAKSALADAKGNTWPVYDAAGSWEQTYVQQGMHRYWRLTKNPEAAEYVRRFANFFNAYSWDPHCQQVGYRLWGVHFPAKDQCLGSQFGRWDPKHDTCPGPGAVHSGWYTRFGPDVAARAFDVTGDAAYLSQAKMYWNRGSKRGYRRTKQSAPDDAVGAFASHTPPKDDSILSTGLTWYLCARRSR